MAKSATSKKPKIQFREVGLRVAVDKIPIIDRAVDLDAESAGLSSNRKRNAFMLRAVLTASRKTILAAGGKIPGEK